MGCVSMLNPRSIQSQPPGEAVSSCPVTTTMSLSCPHHARPGSNGPGCLPTPSVHLLPSKPSPRKLMWWLLWATGTAAMAASRAVSACAAQHRGTCLWRSMSCISTTRADTAVRWSTAWRTRVWQWSWSCGVRTLTQVLYSSTISRYLYFTWVFLFNATLYYHSTISGYITEVEYFLLH